MHKNSLLLMGRMLERHAHNLPSGSLCYDVGSLDINGNYKSMCEGRGLRYVGLDIAEGRNVNIVIGKDGEWAAQLQEKAPLVISGSCFEHVERPWEWIKQIKVLMADGGLFFLMTHASWPHHPFPKDCWRVLPDGVVALAEYAGLTYIEGGLSSGGQDDSRGEDCWAVLKK